MRIGKSPRGQAMVMAIVFGVASTLVWLDNLFLGGQSLAACLPKILIGGIAGAGSGGAVWFKFVTGQRESKTLRGSVTGLLAGIVSTLCVATYLFAQQAGALFEMSYALPLKTGAGALMFLMLILAGFTFSVPGPVISGAIVARYTD